MMMDVTRHAMLIKRLETICSYDDPTTTQTQRHTRSHERHLGVASFYSVVSSSLSNGVMMCPLKM